MAESMHEAIQGFVSDLIGTAGFNYSPEEKNALAVMQKPQERVLKQWIRSSRREYGFDIIQVLPYSTESDSINMLAMQKMQMIYDKIVECEKKHIYPDLPEGSSAKQWELPQNMPQLEGINVEHGLARYQIEVKLIYHKQEV